MASLDRPRLRPLSFSRLEHRRGGVRRHGGSAGGGPRARARPAGRASSGWSATSTGRPPCSRSRHASSARRRDGSRWPSCRPWSSASTGRWCSTGRRSPPSSTPIAGSASARRRSRAARTPRPSGPSGRSWPGSSRMREGAGPPGDDREPTAATLRGIVSPHIDFARGGPVYTWAYKELVEDSDADTFVILGVAHQYCRNRFALTRKDFETPLGLVRTDRAYVDRIAALAGGRPLRRRAGAPDRALDRVPGRLPPVPAGRAEGLLDRADPGRLVPRPHGGGDRPDPG